MRRSLIGILLAIVLLAAAGGWWALERWLSPENLRAMAEGYLEAVTRAPVEVGRVHLAVGVGVQLEGEDVRLWPHADGSALVLERVAVGVEPLSLLTGKLKLRRMRLEGAVLEVIRDEDGRFRAPFGFLDPSEPAESPHPEELLQPLIAIENSVRFLLARPYLAHALEVSRAQVHWIERRDRKPRSFSLAIDEGDLRHRRLRGDAVLGLRGTLSDPAGARVQVHWKGQRERGGEVETALEFSGLSLSEIEPYVRAIRPDAELAGRVQGALRFEAPAPGHGRLEVDLAFEGLEAGIMDASAFAWRPLRADRLDAAAVLAISPQSVGLESARVESGELRLEAAGTLERPLRPASLADLELTFVDLDIQEIRALLDWLPHTRADDFETFVAPVRSGRLRSFTARGGAALSDWQEFFAGRRPIVAMGLGAEADFAEVVLQVGDGERIEELSGRATWSPDRVELSAARALLGGEPLPSLDFAFEGVSHLLETPPERRGLRSGARPLPGAPTLWRILTGDAREGGEPAPPIELQLEVERLDHPVFLWPLENLRVAARSDSGGIRMQVESGSWAGVPILGSADWIPEPEPRARVALRASAPDPDQAGVRGGDAWARGRFRMGPVAHPRWRHESATGSFRAANGTLRLRDLDVALAPAGRLTGSLRLDLSQSAAVPLQLSVALAGGDLDAWIRQLKPDVEVASGRLDAWCSLEGTLTPGRSPFSDLTGLLEISASEGRIRRSLPPIVSIALASGGLNPFAERDSIRYRSGRTLLEFRNGSLFTDDLSIDGPDLRVEASGQVQLVEADHRLEAEVALFLFRQIDRAVGSIPVINVLLLGPDQNLLVAYFQVRGPWGDPQSRIVPFKSLAAGPASLVLQGVPRIVQRGARALGWSRDGARRRSRAAEDPVQEPWEETPWGS